MIATARLNILILSILCILTAGAGTYVTFIRQPNELVQADEAERALAMERSELLGLTTSESRMRQEIQYASHRWHARYKNVEDSLSTADVVDYVNRFAESGFDMLNVEFGGHHHGLNHQYYAFNVTGKGPFEHVYDFIWHMENNKRLYRIEDLMIDDARMDSSQGVQFSFRLLAYFSVPGSMTATDATDAAVFPETAASLDHPIVPEEVLPARRLAINPFSFTRPASSTSSEKGLRSALFSLEASRLVSIAGSRAAFESAGKIRQLTVGDQVREGEITDVDAGRQTVTVTDSRGANHIYRMVSGEPYLLSRSPNRIVPIG